MDDLIYLLEGQLYKKITVYVESYHPNQLVFHGVLFNVTNQLIKLIVINEEKAKKRALINFNKLFYTSTYSPKINSHGIVEIPISKIEALIIYSL